MTDRVPVELLYFEGCPNHDLARELVERVAAEEGIELDLKLIEVGTAEEAERLRFLGSPSLRVNGHDVERGADARESFTLACRVYRIGDGVSGQPAEAWLRTALRS